MNKEQINFNLTKNMSIELIKFNKAKKDLNKLINEYKSNNDEQFKEKINNKQLELEQIKSKFIKEFQKSNKEEIKEYLSIKDQI